MVAEVKHISGPLLFSGSLPWLPIPLKDTSHQKLSGRRHPSKIPYRNPSWRVNGHSDMRQVGMIYEVAPEPWWASP